MDRVLMHAQRMRELVRSKQVPWLGQFAELGGEPMHWVESGHGHPILLVHGLLAWSFTWRLNLATFAGWGRAIAPDLPGFGLSGKPVCGRYDLNAQADWICRFMDHLRLERAIICGHSMGGEIALRLASRHRQRVAGLILVCSAGLVSKHLPTLARLAVRFPDLCAPLVGPVWANLRFAQRVLAMAYHDANQVSAEAVTGYALPASTPGVSRVLPRILAQADFGSGAGAVASVSGPTLLVWGRSDPFVPLTFGQRMHAMIAGSQLTVLDHSGHLPHEEEPLAFNLVVQEWLGRNRPSPV